MKRKADRVSIRILHIEVLLGLVLAVGVFLTAIGVSPETLTSWDALRSALAGLVSNPYLLASAAMALLGQFIDPTTAGIGDSAQAMTYTCPKKADKAEGD